MKKVAKRYTIRVDGLPSPKEVEAIKAHLGLPRKG